MRTSYALIALSALAKVLTAQPPCPTDSELRAILDNHQKFWEPAIRDSIFYHEGRLRPSIRGCLRDGKARGGAQAILALIGEPEDVAAVIRQAPPPAPVPGSNRWAYGVVSALLDPRSEREWAFLRRCALNGYDDRWVDAGAIQTLELIATPRSSKSSKRL